MFRLFLYHASEYASWLIIWEHKFILALKIPIITSQRFHRSLRSYSNNLKCDFSPVECSNIRNSTKGYYPAILAWPLLRKKDHFNFHMKYSIVSTLSNVTHANIKPATSPPCNQIGWLCVKVPNTDNMSNAMYHWSNQILLERPEANITLGYWPPCILISVGFNCASAYSGWRSSVILLAFVTQVGNSNTLNLYMSPDERWNIDDEVETNKLHNLGAVYFRNYLLSLVCRQYLLIWC